MMAIPILTRLDEIRQARDYFRACREQPDCTSDEQAMLDEGIADCDAAERRLLEIIELTRGAVEKFEDPGLWRKVHERLEKEAP